MEAADITELINQRIRAAVAQASDPASASLRQLTAYLAEVLRQARSKEGHSGYKIEGVAIGMMDALGSADLTGDDSYVVPSGWNFELAEIRGYLGLNSTSQSGEAAVAATLGTNLMPSERRLLSAQNCRVGLAIDNFTIKLIENENLALSDLIAPWGEPIRFGLPGGLPRKVIPGQSTIKLELALQDPTAAYAGVSKNYGVILVGALVSCGD